MALNWNSDFDAVLRNAKALVPEFTKLLEATQANIQTLPEYPESKYEDADGSRYSPIQMIDMQGYLWNWYERRYIEILAATRTMTVNNRKESWARPVGPKPNHDCPTYIGDNIVEPLLANYNENADTIHFPDDTYSYLLLHRHPMGLMITYTFWYPWEPTMTLYGKAREGFAHCGHATLYYTRRPGKLNWQWAYAFGYRDEADDAMSLPPLFINLEGERNIIYHNAPKPEALPAMQEHDPSEKEYVAKTFDPVEVVEVNKPTIEHVYPADDKSHASGWTQRGSWRLLRLIYDRTGNEKALRIVSSNGGGTLEAYHQKEIERENYIKYKNSLHHKKVVVVRPIEVLPDNSTVH